LESLVSPDLFECEVSSLFHFIQKKFFIQSDAFLKKLTQVSFSSKDKDFLISLTTSLNDSDQDKLSFVCIDILFEVR